MFKLLYVFNLDVAHDICWSQADERKILFPRIQFRQYLSDVIIDTNYMVPHIGTMKLSKKSQKTLTAVLDRPTRANIRWNDMERLLVAVGADIAEGSGSRVRIKIGDQVKTFHRPHPGKDAKRYAVEATREFLSDHDISP